MIRQQKPTDTVEVKKLTTEALVMMGWRNAGHRFNADGVTLETRLANPFAA